MNNRHTFKVGDKVKVVNQIGRWNGKYLNRTFTISHFHSDQVWCKNTLGMPYWFYPGELIRAVDEVLTPC